MLPPPARGTLATTLQCETLDAPRSAMPVEAWLRSTPAMESASASRVMESASSRCASESWTVCILFRSAATASMRPGGSSLKNSCLSRSTAVARFVGSWEVIVNE